MWTGLRIHYPIIAGRRREKRGGGGGGRVGKNGGGGKIGRRGNEENSARAAPKKRGGDKGGGEIQVYNAYHFKRNEKYSDPLNSPKLFLWFCFSWPYLTHLELKKNVHIFLYIPKQKSACIVQGANKCLEMHDYVPLFWKIFRRRTPRFPLFSLVFIV